MRTKGGCRDEALVGELELLWVVALAAKLFYDVLWLESFNFNGLRILHADCVFLFIYIPIYEHIYEGLLLPIVWILIIKGYSRNARRCEKKYV